MAQIPQIRPFTNRGNIPPNILGAVIVSDGFFKRKQNSDRSYMFRYTASPNSVAVEPFAFHGQRVQRRHQNDKADYAQFPWSLNLKSFLYLQPDPKSKGSTIVWEEETKRYLMDNAYSEFNNTRYREWGSHVYVDNDSKLMQIQIYKQTRLPEDNTRTTNSTWIHDIVPKVRVFKVDKKHYDYCIIKSVIILKHRSIQTNNNMYARWWYRFGRESVTRFIECEANFTEHMNAHINRKIDPYFGVYVDDRAKLVISDPLQSTVTRHEIGAQQAPDRPDHNRTLVLGGVFVIFNTLIMFKLCNNTSLTVGFRRLITLYNQNNQPRITLNDISHPVIVLRALPSNGETLCWYFSLFEQVGRDPMATLEMPSFGLTRINFHDWTEGTRFVRREQQRHRYEQNLQIPDHSNPIPQTDARVTQLRANDQLNLMDIDLTTFAR